MTELIIRESKREDIEAIISLQKQSLGEGLIPRSKAFWHWKHEMNPFGSSPVLLAWDNDQLVGLRAFMNWQWNFEGQTFRALRAVDTATRPDWQGKGLFKKLTLSLLEKEKLNGKAFVFNTPNKQSLPGYLKMGWRWFVKPDLNIRFGSLKGFLNPSSSAQAAPQEWNLNQFDWKVLDAWLINQTNSGIYTPKNSDYLKWRYRDIPEFNYFGAFTEKNGGALIIARIKITANLPELRITELKGANTSYIKSTVSNMIKFYSPAFISCMASFSKAMPFPLKNTGFVQFSNLGPKVVLRKINALPEPLLIKDNWKWTTGDMELF